MTPGPADNAPIRPMSAHHPSSHTDSGPADINDDPSPAIAPKPPRLPGGGGCLHPAPSSPTIAHAGAASRRRRGLAAGDR